MKKAWKAFYYFFPIQLLVNNLKKNQLMMLIWVLLFAVTTQSCGRRYGIPYLFLDPEYLGSVSVGSLFIFGLSLGTFTIAFHITGYIMDANRFRYLGSLPKPFNKFFVNNSLVPLAFIITYIISFVLFQYNSGFQQRAEIWAEVGGFLLGFVSMQVLIFYYFRLTNKDVFKLLAMNLDHSLGQYKYSKVNVLTRQKNRSNNKFKFYSYFELPFSIKSVRDEVYYEKSVLTKVFDQNHLNAAAVEFLVVAIIIVLGLFKDIPYFKIPASASVLILFSVLIMASGALRYWLRGWTLTVLFILFLLINWVFKTGLIDKLYFAYGINYYGPKAEYTLTKLNELTDLQQYEKDRTATLEILEKWKNGFGPGAKPKLVITTFSGGGQRAALWALNSLQVMDSLSKGKLMKHTVMMTGASGGLVGAAYFRELYLQHKLGHIPSPYSQGYYDRFGQDVLNPVLYTAVVNDLFFRFQQFSLNGYSYPKDRGYAFEQQLHLNTDSLLAKPLIAYREPERQALIPMLLVSPTVINDGRKLYITSQDVSYLCRQSVYRYELQHHKVKGIEFRKMFAEQNADSLSFLSALRMSATFPYITPNVVLPSTPLMEIMDAGLYDNFGVTDANRFLYAFKDWISENTSGVVLVCIRDSEREEEIETTPSRSMISRIFTPIGSLYENWDFFQDLQNDNHLDYAKTWLECPLDVVEFKYVPVPKNWEQLKKRHIDPDWIAKKIKQERAALSWHLTTREKQSISRTIYESFNMAELKKLNNLLDYR